MTHLGDSPVTPGRTPVHDTLPMLRQPVSRRDVLGMMGGLVLSGLLWAPASWAKTVSVPPRKVAPASAGIIRSVSGLVYQAWGTHTQAYPMGSVFKLMVTTALLAQRWVGPDDTYECRGTLKLGKLAKDAVHCPQAHGVVSLRRALGVSCNGYFAHYGQRVSPLALTEACDLWGIVPLKPFIPTQTQRQWADVLLGLSDHVKLSPLQMAQMMSRLVQDEIDIAASTRAAIIDGMMLAATEGTAKGLTAYRRDMAVKTGTVPHGAGRFESRFESWITGFLPVDKPSVVFAIHMPNGTSRDAAVPEAIRRLQDFIL